MEEMRNETHMWVLGLYKLSWPANGSFVAIRNFFSFVFFFVVVVVFCFCLVVTVHKLSTSYRARFYRRGFCVISLLVRC